MSTTPESHKPDAPYVDFTLRGDLGPGGAEALPWLWEPYLAFGAVSVLDGDPGTGKSLLTVDLAARIGTGRPMPDGTPAPGHPVHGRGGLMTVFVNAEDGVRTCILPRLLAAGGDPRSVAFLGGLGEGGADALPVRFPDDYPPLRKLLRSWPGSFVVLDPMMRRSRRPSRRTTTRRSARC